MNNIRSATIICLISLTAGIILGVLLGDSICNSNMAALQSKITPFPNYPMDRQAICMEDRTVSRITVNAPYKQHDCVWVNRDGIVCDSCKDAMMYMILDNIDTIKVRY